MSEPTAWEVQPYDGWASLEDARSQWSDAQAMPDDELTGYLQTAYEQCVEFAPAVVGTVIPARLVQAQVMQARAVWRSLTSGDQDTQGPDGYTVTVFPMDWTVKALLRPERGVPVVS
ncbi:hypothetical protein [Cellulosimicrobium arenosum]|uniref:Head-to-tail adaptor n=1 Tax=Cellulosimicrobium arenosum TaxID=2708133 RepID=A0A927IYT3_9MICO|nr:hypothetical protein [Cellulosimicrobium arenosum]MBD8077693.1 hypothetical protein [Cellulosimicrobium arenosum]